VVVIFASPKTLGHSPNDRFDDIVWNLNSTPRKCLGYKTPIEAFAANLGVALEK
jgi:IS30 family transposase